MTKQLSHIVTINQLFLTTVLFRFCGGHSDKCRAIANSLLTSGVPVCVNEVPRVEVCSDAQCLSVPCISRNKKRLCAISLSEAEWIKLRGKLGVGDGCVEPRGRVVLIRLILVPWCSPELRSRPIVRWHRGSHTAAYHVSSEARRSLIVAVVPTRSPFSL